MSASVPADDNYGLAGAHRVLHWRAVAIRLGQSRLVVATNWQRVARQWPDDIQKWRLTKTSDDDGAARVAGSRLANWNWNFDSCAIAALASKKEAEQSEGESKGAALISARSDPRATCDAQLDCDPNASANLGPDRKRVWAREGIARQRRRMGPPSQVARWRPKEIKKDLR